LQEVEGNKLIYLVNYWNKAKWSKEFGPDDEQWETNKALKDKLEYDVLGDGTFWMKFEDWLQQFNTVYYCRIFPENWSQYCIPGNWSGITSGGAPPKYTDQPWVPEKPYEENKKQTTNFNSNKTLTINKPYFQLSIIDSCIKKYLL
jgi:hypothetical protein